MILDATAGNRTIWQHKNSKNIIYIDSQRKLTTKPTIFADNTYTPFLDNIFSTIFYDPPHDWGSKEGYHPEYYIEIKRWAAKHKPFAFTYYGWDVYQSYQELLHHIFKAQKEFYRILKPDGLLWFKWCEIRKPLNKVITLFVDWTELLRIYVKSPTQTAGTGQTFWVCLEKKQRNDIQLTL